MHTKLTVSEIPYPDWPIHALGAIVTAGDPTGSGQTVFETTDKRVHSGVWGCSPGTLELTFGWDQVTYYWKARLLLSKRANLHSPLGQATCSCVQREQKLVGL